MMSPQEDRRAHLIAGIERLRCHRRIDRWLVLGGSWGSTLALAYAETYPQHVTALILFGVTTGRWSEMDWLFRDPRYRMAFARLVTHSGSSTERCRRPGS